MRRLCDTDAFKRLKEQADVERTKLIRAAYLMGVDEPQRRATEDLRRAILYRIREVEKVL